MQDARELFVSQISEVKYSKMTTANKHSLWNLKFRHNWQSLICFAFSKFPYQSKTHRLQQFQNRIQK
jgi:hypothetical protein